MLRLGSRGAKKLFAEQKFKYLDSGEGVLAHKKFFSTGSKRCARVFYMRPSFVNFLIIAGRLSTDSISVKAGRILQRTGVKRRIKQLMMGRTARPGQV